MLSCIVVLLLCLGVALGETPRFTGHARKLIIVWQCGIVCRRSLDGDGRSCGWAVGSRSSLAVGFPPYPPSPLRPALPNRAWLDLTSTLRPTSRMERWIFDGFRSPTMGPWAAGGLGIATRKKQKQHRLPDLREVLHGRLGQDLLLGEGHEKGMPLAVGH